MITEASLAAKLRRLGSNPKEIARNLKARKIKGLDNSCALCPLANFLAITTRDVASVSVDGLWAVVRNLSGACVRVVLPKACQDFVEAFDDGRFKALLCGGQEARQLNPLYVRSDWTETELVQLANAVARQLNPLYEPKAKA